MALNERIVPILSLHQPQVLRLSRRTPLQGSGHQPHRFSTHRLKRNWRPSTEYRGPPTRDSLARPI
jgi:hypothetical protein